MMIRRAVWMGAVTALWVALPRGLWKFFPSIPWTSVSFVFAATVIAIFLKETLIPNWGRMGVGFGDLLAHVHSPPTARQALRWFVRAMSSLILAVGGSHVSLEGAAIEGSQAIALQTRSRSSRWFEHLRRTDAASILAGALAATFGAPLAAIVAVFELRFGGANLAPVFSAVSSIVVTQGLEVAFGIPSFFDLSGAFPDGSWAGLKSGIFWAVLPAVGAFCALVGMGLIAFVEIARESFTQLYRHRVWLGLLVAGALLYTVVSFQPDSYQPIFYWIGQMVGGRVGVTEVGVLAAAKVLGFALVVGIFATTGVFGLVWLMGGMLGFFLATLLGGVVGLGVMVGSAGLLGSVLGIPLAGALIVWEQTRSPALGVAAAIVAFSSHVVRTKMKWPTLIETDLSRQNVSLEDGRVRTIMESLQVKECMVVGAQSVYEYDNIETLFDVLKKSEFPFLPVIDTKGAYLGMLTADAIQDAVRGHQSQSHSSLSQLLEAKDLLYRSREKIPTILAECSLVETRGLFDSTPVVPVLGDAGQWVGLLFSHNVRIAYDEEVARRTLQIRDFGRAKS